MEVENSCQLLLFDITSVIDSDLRLPGRTQLDHADQSIVPMKLCSHAAGGGLKIKDIQVAGCKDQILHVKLPSGEHSPIILDTFDLGEWSHFPPF